MKITHLKDHYETTNHVADITAEVNDDDDHVIVTIDMFGLRYNRDDDDKWECLSMINWIDQCIRKLSGGDF